MKMEMGVALWKSLNSCRASLSITVCSKYVLTWSVVVSHERVLEFVLRRYSFGLLCTMYFVLRFAGWPLHFLTGSTVTLVFIFLCYFACLSFGLESLCLCAVNLNHLRVQTTCTEYTQSRLTFAADRKGFSAVVLCLFVRSCSFDCDAQDKCPAT